ncbi:MAG: TA system VapC family ribonuclease toxin [Terrimicrobiaceae bacterium]
MIVPDTNLLVFAYDTTSPFHVAAKKWWEAVLSGDGPVGIPWIVVLAFTRLMTHPTICADPLTTEQVRRRIGQWIRQPHVRVLCPSPGTMDKFFDLLKGGGLGGNLTTDALIAAHTIENAATLFSNDRDFDRFPGLKWTNPLPARPRNY